MNRMKTYLIAGALVVMAACSREEPTRAHSGPVAWQSDYQAALTQAKAEKKLVMVDLYTDWCHWCKRLDRDVYADAGVAAKLASGFVAVKLNPEKSREAAELAKKFGTRGFPHIVFVDGAGNKVSDIVGYKPAKEFLQRLDALTAGQ
jgi:thiol:disulfide interchange protein